jgi:hypothetical protein
MNMVVLLPLIGIVGIALVALHLVRELRVERSDNQSLQVALDPATSANVAGERPDKLLRDPVTTGRLPMRRMRTSRHADSESSSSCRRDSTRLKWRQRNAAMCRHRLT